MDNRYHIINDKCKIKMSFLEPDKFSDNSTQLISLDNISTILKKKADKMPNDIAVELCYDFRDEIKALTQPNINTELFHKLKNCCFKVNPYIYFYNHNLLNFSNLADESYNKEELELLKTNYFNYVVINKNALEFLTYFNGKNTLLDVYNKFKRERDEIVVINGYMAKHSWKVSTEKEERRITHEVDLLYIVRLMYISNLIQICAVRTYQKNIEIKPVSLLNTRMYNSESDSVSTQIKSNPKGKTVLLLAAAPGTATIGLLHIASFLKRNGIHTYCKYNNLDVDYEALKEDIENLINQLKPQIIGVSIKWFVHMARGLEICKMIKSIKKDIEIVIGGNTASLYYDEFIKNDFIDYIICGDGELPWLNICMGEEYIPNCIYKKDGKIIRNPITYVQDSHNSKDIYLSHLDEILVSKDNLYCVPYYYIYTGKGCLMNCLYCGGCMDAQKKQFKRSKPFLRGINEVRKDIMEIKKYASTLMFVDSFEIDVLKYYKELLAGIDLSNMFCLFYFYKIPSAEFVKILSKTFKYVYLNVDLCSLSERHRKELHLLNLSKPLPKDKDLLQFLSICDNYENAEASISLISGLPYYTKEDMKQSEEMLSNLFLHSSFKGAEWGRLHAQPGAPIVNNCNAYEMYSEATNFDEFLYYSCLNMKEKIYPDLFSYKVPYINFKDEAMTLEVNNHYQTLYSMIKNKCNQENEQEVAYDMITVRELSENVDRLARFLWVNGVDCKNTVAIVDKESINMLISMLAVLKIGGTYFLIDPDDYKKQKEENRNKNRSMVTIEGTKLIPL